MKIKAFFLAGIMGLAVLTGICRGLTSPRGDAEIKERGKEQPIPEDPGP